MGGGGRALERLTRDASDVGPEVNHLRMQTSAVPISTTATVYPGMGLEGSRSRSASQTRPAARGTCTGRAPS